MSGQRRLITGQWFAVNPRLLGGVAGSTAVVDLRQPGPLPEQTRLGDFWLPQRRLFARAKAVVRSSQADSSTCWRPQRGAKMAGSVEVWAVRS